MPVERSSNLTPIRSSARSAMPSRTMCKARGLAAQGDFRGVVNEKTHFEASVFGLGSDSKTGAEGGYVLASRVLTAWYFLHFIVVLPLLGLLEKPKPLPTSISQAVLGSRKAVAGLAVFLAGAALFLGAPSPASRAVI